MLTPLRLQKEPRWTAERLQAFLSNAYREESIIVLANREPFRHDRAPDGRIVVNRSGGGLVTALDPLISACAGVWVAHGAGTADTLVVDERDGVKVPPVHPRYRLRRVWLDADEERRYYYGFANEGLWPLCHAVHVQPVFRSEDFDTYREVTKRFVDAVCEEARTNRPIVLVQDYHFALAPQMIRECLPLSTVVAFWHIPWPHPRDFAICPWDRQLLEGLLGSTLIGFQTQDDCRNFIDTVERSLGAEINHAGNVITYDGHHTTIRPYPVSVEWPSRFERQSPGVETCRTTVRQQLGVERNVLLGVGVDRLDYTKGLTEKFLAVELLLETQPQFRQRFTFAQIAEPSRDCLPAYRDLRSRLVATADRINHRFGTERYQPIILLETRHEPAAVYQFLRAADVCYVGSLHDGMNLVAKEFVCARDDERGVLLLSRFAGAACELTTALRVNPYAIDDCAQALATALTMPGEEQAARMRAMRSVVARSNTYRWAAEMLADAARLRTRPANLTEDQVSDPQSHVQHA